MNTSDQLSSNEDCERTKYDAAAKGYRVFPQDQLVATTLAHADDDHLKPERYSVSLSRAMQICCRIARRTPLPFGWPIVLRTLPRSPVELREAGYDLREARR